MKKIKRFVSMVLCFSLLMCSQAYASGLLWENVPGNHDNGTLMSSDALEASDEYRTIARGDFLSTGITQITNGQDGSIKIYIETYAHHDVDRIFHTVFLDQWDEEDEDWHQVNSWNFVKSKEEAEEDLSLLLTTITVTGYETNKYYRVRGLHGVEYNDEVEACATETDGILITDGPT